DGLRVHEAINIITERERVGIIIADDGGSRGGSGGILKLTCPEPYFLSDGLYATAEELENTREITLHVITIGAFIEDSAKVRVPLNWINIFLDSYKS
ncbi:hypothetical protein ALC62_03495, partial [Cyphomyrmex costatus]